MSGHATVVTPTPQGFTPHKVAHHFQTAEQEFQSSKLGFWLFLATEIMLFGGLFAAYILYHDAYAETFRAGGASLNWKLGSLNTAILLTSSFTMAMAVRAAQQSKKKAMLGFLVVTWLCAAGFMVVKYIEYTTKFEHGIGPGYFFDPHGHYLTDFAGLPFPNLYFALYFTMTGIHGLHVLVGMIVIGWLIWRGGKGHFHSGFYTPVDLVGLYWHVVDVIWIFLFPLLYLVP